MPLTGDIGVIEQNKMLVEMLIKQFKGLLKVIEMLDKAIKLAYKAQLAPRLLVAFDSNRDRYNEASELYK